MIAVKSIKPRAKKNNLFNTHNNSNKDNLFQAYTNAKIKKGDINNYGIKTVKNKNQMSDKQDDTKLKTQSLSKAKTIDHSVMQSQSNSKSKKNNSIFHTPNKICSKNLYENSVHQTKKSKQSPIAPSNFHIISKTQSNNKSKSKSAISKRKIIDIQSMNEQNQKKLNLQLAKKQKYLSWKANQMINQRKDRDENYKQKGVFPFSDILKQKNVSHKQNPKKQQKLNDSTNEQQFTRLVNLKKYLEQDTQRMTKIKRISDQHVLSELGISQNMLIKQIESVRHEAQCTILQYKRQMDQTNYNYKLSLQNNMNQIDNLKNQLTQQRTKRVKAECKLKQNQVLTKCIKDELTRKQKQCQHTKTLIQKQKLQCRLIQQKLISCNKEKQYIKKQAEEVLLIVRQQLITSVQ